MSGSDPETDGLGALAGLRVVELGVWVAAPATAALLADWGADVIKIEPPTGDPMRGVFGSLGIGDSMPNPAFALDNRGKRSVVLDLREVDARARLDDLLATADVFISNLRPDALDKLGLEPEPTVARSSRPTTASSISTAEPCDRSTVPSRSPTYPPARACTSLPWESTPTRSSPRSPAARAILPVRVEPTEPIELAESPPGLDRWRTPWTTTRTPRPGR